MNFNAAADIVWRNCCINPYKKKNHVIKKNLSAMPQAMREQFPIIGESCKICVSCRIAFYKNKTGFNNNNETSSSSDELELLSDEEFILPIKSKKRKFNNTDNEYNQAGVTTLNQIKDKFQQSSKRSERIMLLTLAPKYWSRQKLMTEFNSTEWEARKAKELVKQSGILTGPSTKKGVSLSPQTVDLVKTYYERDDISRLMPGVKDYVSLKQNDGRRQHVQKRLVLANLNELFAQFKAEHTDVKIGFTKFTQLRPLHCVLAGSSGTHTVCVCVHHENFKLMLSEINVNKLTEDSNMILNDYHDFIQAIICIQPTSSCFLNECALCPGTTALHEILTTFFDNNFIDELKFDTWLQTDRYTLKTVVLKVDAFIDEFIERLIKLKSHDFIAKQQSKFVKDLKEKLLPGEFVVTCDFAENYAFVVQNSAQSFHWNNNQVTIFTVVTYFNTGNEIKHKSMAILSDNLTHDSAAVYCYQNIIIDYLKMHYEPRKIFYVTDGASQHFKNRSNFANLLQHEKDFNLPAEWHFHATAHGKGACDGIGANLKRGAARASLVCCPKNHILTIDALYQWAKKFCFETEVFLCKKEDQAIHFKTIEIRFKNAVTIPGTLKYHAFIPMESGNMMLKKFSMDESYETYPKIKRSKCPRNQNLI